MGKRFTETTKWTQNKWFRKLSNENKLFWLYLLDNCDSVGVWEEDVEFVSMVIRSEYSAELLLKDFERQITVIQGGKKWWVKDFISYQYGVLKEENIKNKPHQSYISLLKKHSLWIDYVKTISSLKEKEEDKDKDKEKDKDKRKETFKNKILEFLDKYDSVLLDEFFEYWTESNTGSNVLRFEMSKNQPFDISRRLGTWKKNQTNGSFKPKLDTHELGEQDYTKTL